MVSLDSLILFHKSMYVVTQLQYLSRNLATIWVSELEMSFVTLTQTDVYVVYLNSYKFLFLEINYCDLVTLCHSFCISYGSAHVLSNY